MIILITQDQHLAKNEWSKVGFTPQGPAYTIILKAESKVFLKFNRCIKTPSKNSQIMR